jgi:hypothetical protein
MGPFVYPFIELADFCCNIMELGAKCGGCIGYKKEKIG